MIGSEHSHYLNRCYQLAQLSGKEVGTNPKVGALLVYKNRIIGEGRYETYGSSHAEINALNSVRKEDKIFTSDSTLYVSLEPCCIYGKTPPCTSAILAAGIKEIHIGAIDSFPKIDGKGADLLQNEGVNVNIYNDPKALELIAPFTTYHLKKRPFITLKFAKSKDHYMGKADQQVWLTNNISSIFTHKLRANSHAILVGTNTATLDNPRLTNRHFWGDSPLRIAIDKTGRIPQSHHLLSDGGRTLVFNQHHRKGLPTNVSQITLQPNTDYIKAIMKYCHENHLVHLMVEGGAKLLQSFIKSNYWDKAVVLETNHILENGIKAPLVHGRLQESLDLGSDKIIVISNSKK